MKEQLGDIRRELAGLLAQTPGVIGVGIGREAHGFVLVVLVDPDRFEALNFNNYKGYDVVTRSLGKGHAHLDNRRLKYG